MMRRILPLTILLLFLAPEIYCSEGGGHDLTSRMMLLAIQMGVIIFAAKFANIAFARLHLPGVLGEVMVGTLIGPYLLGAVPLPWFSQGIFPHGDGFPISPELYGICSVASIVLLFSVGLETDIRLLRRYTAAGMVVGISGVVISFILGDLTTVFFSNLVFGKHLGFFAPPCLFLGVISTATSVGITARILSEKRKLDSPEGVTILAGAVIDDVLGIIVLAVILGVISSAETQGAVNWGAIGLIAGKAVGMWLAATVGGLLLARRIGDMLKRLQSRSTIAFMSLGLALILAGLFEHAGLAMIVGAYVMGLSLSQTDINHLIRERLSSIHSLLVPVFFCVMGMLVDFSALGNRNVLIFGAVYTLVAILAKVIGCGAAVLPFGFNLRGAIRVGVGMLPRGEIALIIAGIGMAKNILSPEVMGVAILMMMLTTMIAPTILICLFKGDLPGTTKPPREGAERLLHFAFSSIEVVNVLRRKLVSVFEAEGCFVHLLDSVEGLYQVRKDEMIFGLRLVGTNIEFECRENEVSFINTAMYEVIAELERMIRDLRNAGDANAIARRVQDDQTAPAGDSSLARYIRPYAFEPNLRATTKEEVIDELLVLLERTGLVKDPKEARRVVWEREQSMSTGMQHGIAIPHGRTDSVSELICAVGTSKEGIDFGSLDGELSRIFILTISPASAAVPYVQFIAMIIRALDADGRARMLASSTVKEMMSVLTGEDVPPL